MTEKSSSMLDDRDANYYRVVQRGEFAAAIVAGSFAFITGVWLGLWIMPVEALAVPVETVRGRTSLAYQPVPTYLPLVSFGVVLLGVYAAGVVVSDRSGSEASDDGGEPSDD